MSLYHYSIVRCVPEPRTGEFVNIAAIAGSSDEDDWQLRQLNNEARARKLCSKDQLAAVHGFLTQAGQEIDAKAGSLEPLTVDWLWTFHREMRNVVQLSAPQMADVADASTALEFVFDRLLIDPEQGRRGYIDKNTLLARLRKAFAAKFDASEVREKPSLHVGDHVRADLDFAAGKDGIVHVTQAWSFQKGGVEDVATDVKSWGYAMQRLRDGDTSRVLSREGAVLDVKDDVEIDVLLAEPKTSHQVEVFEEAEEVFKALDVHVRKSADDVSDSARQLVSV